MVQWLRAHTVLSEDWGLVPSLQWPVTLAPGGSNSSGFFGHLHSLAHTTLTIHTHHEKVMKMNP